MMKYPNEIPGYPWNKKCYYCGELISVDHNYNKYLCPKCGRGDSSITSEKRIPEGK